VKCGRTRRNFGANKNSRKVYKQQTKTFGKRTAGVTIQGGRDRKNEGERTGGGEKNLIEADEES